MHHDSFLGPANVLGVTFFFFFGGGYCSAGSQDGLSNGQPSQAVSEDSSSEPLVCAGQGMLMAAGSRTRAGGTHPTEVFSPQPSSPCAAEEEPLGSLAADGYVLAIPSPAGQYPSQRCPQMSFQAAEDSWLCSLAVPQQSRATAGITASCALKAIITLHNHSARCFS